MEQSNSVADKAMELLGQAQPVSRQPKKETVMSFKKGPIFMALKIVAPFNKEKQEYEEPEPKIVYLVDGKYIRMPIDSKLFGEFGDFLKKLSELTDGIKVPEKEIDIETAKAKILRLSGRSAE